MLVSVFGVTSVGLWSVIVAFPAYTHLFAEDMDQPMRFGHLAHLSNHYSNEYLQLHVPSGVISQIYRSR